MIKSLLRAYLVNLFSLWVVASYIGAFHLNDGLRSFLIVGAGFTLLHLFVKPVLSLITGPLNFLSLGLVGLTIDAAILYVLTLYFPQVSITAWNFPGAQIQGLVIPSVQFTVITATVLCALIINIIRQLLLSLAD